MTAVELLLDRFQHICDVQDGTDRLRQFVVDLAVRGKLVDQDARDEPASELLRRLVATRRHLTDEGLVRKQDVLPLARSSDSSVLPAGWVRTQIGEILTVIRGASPRPKGDPKYFSASRTAFHWIKISDIRKHGDGRVLRDTDEFLTEEGMRKSVCVPRGTLVLTNSATIGVPIILDIDGGCIHDGYLAFPHFPSELSVDFVVLLFRGLQHYASQVARGMAQLNLNTSLVRSFPIALPPLAEQARIVSRVNQLMAICDHLEAAQGGLESNRQALITSVCSRLSAPKRSDIRAADTVRFLLDALPRMFRRSEQIEPLRQALVSVALRGDLGTERLRARSVERDGGLDTASELPEGWRTVTLGELATEFRYGTSTKCSYEPVGEPVLRIPNVSGGRVRTDDLKYGKLRPQEAAELRLRSGDVLMIRSNGSLGLVGRGALVEDEGVGHCFAGYLVRVRTDPGAVYGRYLVLALNSPQVREQIEGPIRSAVGLKNINVSEFGRLKIPFPPFDEQVRIVSRLAELSARLDALAQALAARDVAAAAYRDAVVGNVMQIVDGLSSSGSSNHNPLNLVEGQLVARSIV